MHNPQEDELIQQIASYCNITEQHDRVLPYVTITLEKAASFVRQYAAKARLDELEAINKLHVRAIRQVITDNNGQIYLDDTRLYISKYEVQDRIKQLKKGQV